MKKLFAYIIHKKARLILLTILTVLCAFCTPNHKVKGSMDNSLFAYDLKNPDTRFKLPSSLEEISGISYYGKGKIACVQDEKANIYILDLKKEKIIQEYDFGSDADYEDIVIVGTSAYILRNNGLIFRVKDFKKKERRVKKFTTPLKKKNNTEGIAFDALSNSLFISCKGSPSIDQENIYEGYKAVYKFDLERKELIKTPHFLIDKDVLDSYIDNNGFTKLSIKIAKKLRLIENETNFQPSGIAIHPLNDQIYIISSVGKLLIILNRRGDILDVRELDARLFMQPEGICFSPTGDLFISNEGRGEKGYILKFSYHAD